VKRLSTFLKFLRDEEGQDLIEYTLLIAFVSLSAVVIFTNTGTSVNAIWKDAKNTLSNAAVVAGS